MSRNNKIEATLMVVVFDVGGWIKYRSTVYSWSRWLLPRQHNQFSPAQPSVWTPRPAAVAPTGLERQSCRS